MVRQANAGRGVTYSKGSAMPSNMVPTSTTMDPTMQPSSQPPRGKEDKFDRLYAKVLQETEGVLSKSGLPEAGEPAPQTFIVNGRTNKHDDSAVLSDQGSFRSAQSRSSGGKQRPMQIEDLQDVFPGSQKGSSSPQKSPHYTETFEKDDSEVSDIEEIMEELSGGSGHSSPQKSGIHIGSDDGNF